MTKTTNATFEATTQELIQSGVIASLNRWTKGGHDRTYIRVSGYTDSYHGCREHQLYWDHQAQMLVNKAGRGRTPEQFDAAVAAVNAAFAASLVEG